MGLYLLKSRSRMVSKANPTKVVPCSESELNLYHVHFTGNYLKGLPLDC